MKYNPYYESKFGAGHKQIPSKNIRTDRVNAAEHDEDIRYALLRTSTASQAVRELEGDR